MTQVTITVVVGCDTSANNLVAPPMDASDLTTRYKIRDSLYQKSVLINEYSITGTNACYSPATTLTLQPDSGTMDDYPWIAVNNRDIVIGDITDPSLDGTTVVFTVIATDSNFGTNENIEVTILLTAVCLTSSINALEWDSNSPSFAAIDGAGPVSNTFNSSGVAFNGASTSNSCGTIT